MLNGDPVSDKYPELIEVMKYIRQNLHEPLTIEQLSRYAAYSPFHFIRIFKGQTGLELRHEDADSEQQQRPEMRGLRFAQAGSPFPQYDEKARSRLRDPNVTQALLSNIMLFYIKGYS